MDAADAPGSSLTGHDILILSTQDWDALPTRKHRFAHFFAEQGNRVLYVEQQMHWAGWLVDIRHQFTRAWRWLKGPRLVQPNLWVFTLPVVLPFFQMWAPLNTINNRLLVPVLRDQLRRLRFRSPILWTYTPHSGDFVGKLGERVVVYECVDDFTSSKGLINPVTIGRLEGKLIQKCDLLIVTADALAASKGGKAGRLLISHNGVDTAHFSQAADPALPIAEALRGVQHPVIGYLGTINYWINTELLARIATAHPEWTVVLVGPHDLLGNLAPLKGLPNVILTGRVPYAQTPHYLRAFDVCVNPYHLDGVAEHCSPLKLYEYLATGKPIVSVDMPEARRFDGLIAIARDEDDFVTLVEKAVSSGSSEGVDARMAEARLHTWERRFEEVAGMLLETLQA